MAVSHGGAGDRTYASVDERLVRLRHAAHLERQNAVTAQLADVQAGHRAVG